MAVSSPASAQENLAWWTRLRRLPPGAVDVIVAVVLGLAVTLAALSSSEPGAREWPPASYLLGIGLGALTLPRRRWPLAVLVLSTIWVAAYHFVNLPAIGSTWPLGVALYTAASAGRLWPAIWVSVATLAGTAWARLLVEPEPVLAVLGSGMLEIAIPGLAIALGDAVRSRRGWAAEAHDRVRRVERDRDRETRRRIVEERLRIARELHDITAHTLAVAGIQLNVAADALNDSPDESRSALRTAQQANREATAELKAAVRVLRQEQGDGVPRAPTPGLDGVERLLDGTRQAGLQVDYDESGSRRPLPAPVGLAVYRVIQEALTNVLQHADASTVTVRVNYEPTGVSVRVADDGRGPEVAPYPPDLDGQGGHGLIGMRERTLGLGGEFAAGPGEDGGFAVQVWIPVEAAP